VIRLYHCSCAVLTVNPTSKHNSELLHYLGFSQYRNMQISPFHAPKIPSKIYLIINENYIRSCIAHHQKPQPSISYPPGLHIPNQTLPFLPLFDRSDIFVLDGASGDLVAWKVRQIIGLCHDSLSEQIPK